MSWLIAVALSSSLAADPTFRLVYAREALACPEQAALERSVAERLGRDPFSPSAERTVSVRMSRDGASLVAQIRVLEPNGAAAGQRQIVSSSEDCAELAAATALAVAIAIDPLVITRPAPDPTPPPRVEIALEPFPAPMLPPPPVVLEPAAEPPSPERERGRFYVGGGGALSIADLPTAAPAGMVDAYWTAGRLELGARMTVTGGGAGRLQGLLIDAGPVVCLRFWLFGGCLLGRFGALQMWVPDSVASTTTPAASFGFEPFFDLPLGDWVRLRLRAGLQVHTALTVVQQSPTAVWRSPLISGGIGVALAFRAFEQRLP